MELPKVNNNQLFTPSTLLLLIGISLYTAGLQFKNNDNAFAMVIAASVLMAGLKTYIYTFASIEKALELKKWIPLTLHLLLSGGQFVVLWIAVNKLTENAYPDVSLGMMCIALALFYGQELLSKARGDIWSRVVVLAVYILLYGFLYFRIPVGNNRLYVASVQTVAYTLIITQGIQLFQTAKHFVHRKLSESADKV